MSGPEDAAFDATAGLSPEEREDRGWEQAVNQMHESLAGMPPRQRLKVLAMTPELRGDRPWPLLEILRKLADSSDHLLRDHGCDRHGHEEVRAAVRSARGIIAAFEGHHCFICGDSVPEPMVCDKPSCEARARMHAPGCPCNDCRAGGPTKNPDDPPRPKKGDSVLIEDRHSPNYGKTGLLFIVQGDRGTVSVANPRSIAGSSSSSHAMKDLVLVRRSNERLHGRPCKSVEE